MAEATPATSAAASSAAAEPEMITIEVHIPADYKTGSKLEVRLPSGKLQTVIVLPTAAPGSKVRFKVPEVPFERCGGFLEDDGLKHLGEDQK